MKSVLRAVALLMSLMAIETSAQSDYTVRWTISEIFRSGIVEVEYDFNVGSSYIAAYGAVIDFRGSKRPSTGSCYVTEDNGVFCEMTIASGGFILDLDESLNGDIRVLNGSGIVSETGLATVSEIN